MNAHAQHIDTPHSKRALVIEDSRFTRTVICDVLRDGGYETADAETGAAGLKYIKAGWPDIVLLDMRLPDQNGFDLLPLIKQEYPDVPVVVLSAAADVTHRVRGLRLGADDYLTKPFVPEELMARVDNVLRLHRQLQSLTHDRDEMAARVERDELTGLPNRHKVQDDLETMWLQTLSRDQRFAVVKIDIADYRSVSAEYGPAAADAVVRHVADSLRELVRHSDIVGRFEGDEFMVLLSEASQIGAAQVTDRLRRHLAYAPCPLPDGTRLGIGVHCGVAIADANRFESIEDVLAAAERDLNAQREAAGGEIATVPVIDAEPEDVDLGPVLAAAAGSNQPVSWYDALEMSVSKTIN